MSQKNHTDTYFFHSEKFTIPPQWFAWYGSILFILIGLDSILFFEVNVAGFPFITYLFLGITLAYGITGGVLLGLLARRLRAAARITSTFKESRDRYAHALESSGTGTWEWTLSDTNISVYVSERWCSLYGYTDESAPKTFIAWTQLVHPEDQEAFKRLATHAIATQARTYTNTYRLRIGTSDNYRYVRDHGSFMEEGGKQTLVGSTYDETSIRMAEEILKYRTAELRRANKQIKEEVRNTRKFRQAVENAHDAIAIIDSVGNIVHANDAWYTLIGIAKDSAPKKFFTPFKEHTSTQHIHQLEKALREATPFMSDTLHGVRPDEKKAYTAEISLSPVVEEGKTLFFAVIAGDVTERKEIDRAKTEFVSLASHQLRTPLSAIRWYTEMLKEGMGGTITSTQKSYLEEVYRANLRMIELVNSLLNVSRIDMGTVQSEPEKITIPPVVKSVLGELRPQITEKKLSVREIYAPDLPEQWFDPKQMRMIFQNLISNAVKYTPEGGRVEVTVRPEGKHVFFSVSDSGIGIPKEQQPQIFNKLFRADNAREIDTTGTGLGLYIIKSIIEKEGGSLRFESEPGTGTTFYGILPIRKEKPSEDTGSKPLV